MSLITRGRQAQFRPCSLSPALLDIAPLDPAPLDQVTEWAEQCRDTWRASFDRMDTYLQSLQPLQSEQPT